MISGALNDDDNEAIEAELVELISEKYVGVELPEVPAEQPVTGKCSLLHLFSLYMKIGRFSICNHIFNLQKKKKNQRKKVMQKN